MTRILWFHPRPWGPPRGGGDLRTRGLVACALTSGHTVGLVVPAGSGPQVLPEGLSLLELTPRGGWSMHLHKLASRHPLRSPRISGDARRAARRAIEGFAPEIAVVSEVMSWSVARGLAPPGIPLVYDAANVESALFRGLAADASGTLERLTFGVDARRVAADEAELLASSQAVMAVSDEEKEIFAGLGGLGRIEVVPSSVEDPGAVWLPGPQQDEVLFVGTLDYPPNVQAVVELVEKVLPAVRRIRPARLVVVGRRPTPALRDLAAAHSWIDLHEDVPDLTPFYLRARCAVLPIRSGGGTKLKVYEALAYGIPLVCTPEAAAGVPVTAAEEVAVASATAELVQHTVTLLEDDVEAQRLGSRGRTAFVERLSWERAARRALQGLIEDLSSPDRS